MANSSWGRVLKDFKGCNRTVEVNKKGGGDRKRTRLKQRKIKKKTKHCLDV